MPYNGLAGRVYPPLLWNAIDKKFCKNLYPFYVLNIGGLFSRKVSRETFAQWKVARKAFGTVLTVRNRAKAVVVSPPGSFFGPPVLERWFWNMKKALGYLLWNGCSSWSLAAGRESLVTGSWSRITGHWQLVANRWSLAAGRESLVTGSWSRAPESRATRHAARKTCLV